MVTKLILASQSKIRADLLTSAGLDFEQQFSVVDEESIKASLVAASAEPIDIAGALAEAKARKISNKQPMKMVLGCDQVLNFDGRLMSKPTDKADAFEQLLELQGKSHILHSAAVICQGGQPIWRKINSVKMTMRIVSGAYLEDYVERNWSSIRESVGSYKLEEEGVRLFSHVKGDYFTVLGLPLLDLISFLTLRGELEI